MTLHPFDVRDMHRTYRLGDLAAAPDGGRVAFTRRSWDEKTDKTTTSLWAVTPDGAPAPLVRGLRGHADSSPTWSRDGGTVAFVSDRSKPSQIWTAGPGRKPTQLTRLPVEVDNIRWSPRGDLIAFSAEVYLDAGGLGETARRDKRRATEPKALKFDRLFVRHWDRWHEGKRSHLFVLRVSRSKGSRRWKSDGAPKDLMKGFDGDCPVKPFGGREDYDWSPDGKELAFTAQTGRDEAWSTDTDIYVVPSKGGAPRCITEENKASDSSPVYSPDGRAIAYLAMVRPGFESDRRRVRVYDRKTGETRTLTEGWDRSPASLAWSPDSRFLYATVSESARVKVYKIDAIEGTPTEIVGEHHNGSVVASGSGLFYAQDSMDAAAEVWASGPDGGGGQKLTRWNEQRLGQAKMSQPEEFFFQGAGGAQVQGWILKPVGFVPSRKYPVAFVIHGGPQGAIEDSFHYRWNLQAFAGAGYGVVAVNFHGSTGFGQEFTDSISGDWGGKPFEDLMKGLDFALEKHPWLRGDRVAALGASYGGWMINWINGHTDRFRCLVNHDGGFDEFVSYFTTDELWFPEWEFRGTPWENPGLYDRFSNSRHVADWKTPTLVIHGAKDYRLVDGEGIATFTALQRRGIPSRLLYFPDENHWVLKPRNSIVWYDNVLAWLKKWLSD